MNKYNQDQRKDDVSREERGEKRRIMKKTNFNSFQLMHDLAFPCRPKMTDDIFDDSAHVHTHSLIQIPFESFRFVCIVPVFIRNPSQTNALPTE